MFSSRQIFCCAVSLLAMPAAAFANPDQPSPFLSARLSMQEAILGGPSRLQMIAMQQKDPSAIAAPAVHTAALNFADDLPRALPASTFVQSDSAPKTYEFPRTRPASPDRPDVFGTVALAVGQTPFDARWQRVQAKQARGFENLQAGLQGRDRYEQARLINQRVNAAVRFEDDSKVYGVADRWASASETIGSGRGDCEDYAIAKLQLLRDLGFDAEDLYLTIVKDLVRRADHAVLVARIDGRFVVLDNNSDRLLEASEVSDYRPVFTMAAGKSWIHGYQRETQYAGLAGGGISDAAR